jgi:hypothetical protein
VTAPTDWRGDIVARYLYDPYRRLLGKWGALADANRYRFSSKEWQPQAGLYYYGYRLRPAGSRPLSSHSRPHSQLLDIRSSVVGIVAW